MTAGKTRRIQNKQPARVQPPRFTEDNSPQYAGTDVRSRAAIDGASHTLLIVEAQASGIHWMEPRDLSIESLSMKLNDGSGNSPSSNHPGGLNVLFTDGSVSFIADGTATDLRDHTDEVGSLSGVSSFGTDGFGELYITIETRIDDPRPHLARSRHHDDRDAVLVDRR